MHCSTSNKTQHVTPVVLRRMATGSALKCLDFPKNFGRGRRVGGLGYDGVDGRAAFLFDPETIQLRNSWRRATQVMFVPGEVRTPPMPR